MAYSSKQITQIAAEVKAALAQGRSPKYLGDNGRTFRYLVAGYEVHFKQFARGGSDAFIPCADPDYDAIVMDGDAFRAITINAR